MRRGLKRWRINMKGKKRVKLLGSQKILLQMKSEKINEAINLLEARKEDIQQTLDMIVIEQGIPKENINQWRLTEDGQAIEKIEEQNSQKNKKDKKEKNK